MSCYFTILYSDQIFLNFLIYSNSSTCMIYTRIAFPHCKFHIEERKECSSLLTLAWSKRVIIPIFCLKPVLSEKQSNNFYICKTRVWLKPVCIGVWGVYVCAHRSPFPLPSRGNTWRTPTEFTIEKIFPQRQKVVGIHYKLALFQESVSEYYFSSHF